MIKQACLVLFRVENALASHSGVSLNSEGALWLSDYGLCLLAHVGTSSGRHYCI